MSKVGRSEGKGVMMAGSEGVSIEIEVWRFRQSRHLCLPDWQTKFGAGPNGNWNPSSVARAYRCYTHAHFSSSSDGTGLLLKVGFISTSKSSSVKVGPTETTLFLALKLKYRQVAVLYVPPFKLGFGYIGSASTSKSLYKKLTILLSLSEDRF